MQKVIPPGLNYADIKPEAIENQIRIVKFTPIATIQAAQPNDIVRFHLQGNGFYDPYSAYIRIEIDIDDIPDVTSASGINGKFLDRSAHSLFSRLVIRSQGTELERIEQYDVMAAMINDMIYSSEQRLLHHYEGFASRQLIQSSMFYDEGNKGTYRNLPHLLPGSSDNIVSHAGEFGVFKMGLGTALADKDVFEEYKVSNGDTKHFITKGHVSNPSLAASQGTFYPKQKVGVNKNGQPVSVDQFLDTFSASSGTFGLKEDADLGIKKAGLYYQYETPKTLVFTIPIYSGILGVLMPEKKFLPMSLLPLEVEFTMNPHAFYAVGECKDRKYKVKRFEIWTHTLFFEQELHRSLEAVVAESGIFLHYNSFYLAPVNTYNGLENYNINRYNQLGVFLKSISAVHWVFLYNSYEQDDGPRKLHFVCHNVSSLQMRNGMDLIPSEPIIARTGGDTLSTTGGIINNHSQYLIETYKAWNKMHDPSTDGALNSFNYNLDNVLTKPTTVAKLLEQQLQIGRCQYGLSLEGEELGQNKSIITGKKSVMPFDINLNGIKSQQPTSYMLCFLRADFIIYVRPDLVVTRLGL